MKERKQRLIARIQLLRGRLEQLRNSPTSKNNAAIREVALGAIRDSLTVLGRQMYRLESW